MDEKKSGRLQSLKIPRDLSLGLTKPKKQYAPNLNVVRNKDKPKEFLKKIDQKRKERTANREKQNHEGRYVQQTGVFSQGAGENIKKGIQIERVSFRNNERVSSVVMPTINKNAFPKKEEPVFDDDDDDDEMNGESDDDTSFAPVTLALDNFKVKRDIILKKEEGDILAPEPFNGDFSEENPALALVKLPDSFAGKGFSDDPNVKKLFDYPLSGMLEGEVGKLRIRKSGRVEVQIGRIKYELIPENTFESREELATITDGQNNEKNIAILGRIMNNFIMFPEYDKLLPK